MCSGMRQHGSASLCIFTRKAGTGGGLSSAQEGTGTKDFTGHTLCLQRQILLPLSPPFSLLGFCNHFCILPANRFLRVQAEAPRVCFSLFVCCGKTREQLPPVGSRGILKLCVPSLPSSAKVALCKQGGGEGRSVEAAVRSHREGWRLARGRWAPETAHSLELYLRVTVELVDLAKLCGIGQAG